MAGRWGVGGGVKERVGKDMEVGEETQKNVKTRMRRRRRVKSMPNIQGESEVGQARLHLAEAVSGCVGYTTRSGHIPLAWQRGQPPETTALQRCITPGSKY